MTKNWNKSCIKKYFFYILNLVFLFSVFTKNLFPQNLTWQQKLIVKDFTGKYKGWVEIFISTCSANFNYQQDKISDFQSTNSSSCPLFNQPTKQPSNPLVKYCAVIISDTDLPFWFFSGKSKTYECEFYDENFLPIESDFNLYGTAENFKIVTKKSSDTFNILWKSSKGLTKEKILPANKNVLTTGNLRNIIMSLDLTKKDSKTFFLLDKFKLENKRITISSSGKGPVINNIDTYRINIDISFFGKFSFYIDKNYNVVYGEGMGIKVFPEK